jgi:16S rRNA (guanine(966)-N(2))-methyltransferase RsmD
VRIVAGRLGGRVLRAPAGRDTRPTSDRVREALFSILGSVGGDRVLDLFAGSGALGLEAVSRGAERLTLVDAAGPAIRAIRANLAQLGVAAEVHQSDALRYLERARTSQRQYDLVFLDPPYRQAEVLSPLLSAALPVVLAPGARVVAESERRQPLALDLDLSDERHYGNTTIRIYRVPN